MEALRQQRANALVSVEIHQRHRRNMPPSLLPALGRRPYLCIVKPRQCTVR
jgi:hypothetical protein